MFTPMLSAPGSGYAKLERMQKWVTFPQLEFRKLISERTLGENSGPHGVTPPLAISPTQNDESKEKYVRLHCLIYAPLEADQK